MEWQKVDAPTCASWFTSTPIFNKIADEMNQPVKQLFETTLSSLIAGKVAERQGNFLVNIG
jgi:hypothetical protein